MVESTKLFIRWMDGTCVETPEQRLGRDDEEPFVFSFYNDIQMNPLVIKAILGLDNPIRKAINSIKQCAALCMIKSECPTLFCHTTYVLGMTR